MSNERSPDKPTLNPFLEQHFYDNGFALSVKNNPFAEPYEHEINALQYVNKQTQKAIADIEAQRAAYQIQLNAEFEIINTPEYKQTIETYKKQRLRK